MIYLLSLLALICAINFSYAQNTFPTGVGTYAGIGLTSPQGALHITNPGNQWSSYNYGTNIIIQGSKNNAIGLFDNNGAYPWAIVNGGGLLQFATMPALGDVSTNPGIKFTLNASGNIGIGTTTPHQRLDLNGGNLAMGDINNTGVITFRNDISVGNVGSVSISAIDAAGNGNNDGIGVHVSDGLKYLAGQILILHC